MLKNKQAKNLQLGRNPSLIFSNCLVRALEVDALTGCVHQSWAAWAVATTSGKALPLKQ